MERYESWLHRAAIKTTKECLDWVKNIIKDNKNENPLKNLTGPKDSIFKLSTD